MPGTSSSLLWMGSTQCSIEYEQALKQIHLLEQQLHEARSHITHLETTNHNITASLNQSLFDELVPIAPGMVSASFNVNQPYTIDLTSDNETKACHPAKVFKCSRNKLKKYIKINKYITKTQKLVKRHKYFIKNVKLNRERFGLLKKLEIYSFNLKQSTKKYKADTEDLRYELENLQEKLMIMTSKYNASENQMREYVLAMNELVGSQTNNFELCKSPPHIYQCDYKLTQPCSLPVCDATMPLLCESLSLSVVPQNNMLIVRLLYLVMKLGRI